MERSAATERQQAYPLQPGLSCTHVHTRGLTIVTHGRAETCGGNGYVRTILAALVCQYTAGQKFRSKFLVNASSKRGREDGTACLDFAKEIVQSL